jgi:hypothetical protein
MHFRFNPIRNTIFYLDSNNFFYTLGAGLPAGKDCSPNVTAHSCCPDEKFVKNCGYDTWGTASSLASPRYPLNPFASNLSNLTLHCMWNIYSPPGSHLTLQITDFDLGSSDDRLFILETATCRPFSSDYYSVDRPPTKGLTLRLYQDSVAVYLSLHPGASARGVSIAWSATTVEQQMAAPEDRSHVGAPNLLPAVDDCEKTVRDWIDKENSNSIVKNCGFSATVGEEMNISSMGADREKNGGGKFCAWNIVAPPGTLVSLAVLFFNLHPTAGDKLFILDPATCSNAAVLPGSSSSSFLTGWLNPGKVIALGQEALSLYYYSPQGGSSETVSVADRGLNLFASFSRVDATAAEYAANKSCLDAVGLVRPMPDGGHVPVDFVQNCGADHLNVSSGELVSPVNYGRVNRRCVWRVWAPQAKQLKIIVEVDREDISYWDRLFILNSDCGPLGDSSTEILEGGSYIISDNAFYVYFYTDENIIPRSFRIFWTTL